MSWQYNDTQWHMDVHEGVVCWEGAVAVQA